MVQASNSFEGGEAENVYSSGTSTWCTSSRDPNPYIELQFTSPVLISRMLTRGYTWLRPPIQTFPACSLRRYYVTNFTLEHSPPDNSSVLNYYTSVDESNSAATPDNKIVSWSSSPKLCPIYHNITIPCTIVLFITWVHYTDSIWETISDSANPYTTSGLVWHWWICHRICVHGCGSVWMPSVRRSVL